MTPANRFTPPGWWRPAGLAFFAVTLAQLALAAGAGTDIPFQDQWDLEGIGLYPTFLTHTLNWAQLFRVYNENRIVWTHLVNLGLFGINGQWDPLVQLAFNAVLHGTVAGLLVWAFAQSFRGGILWVSAGFVSVVSLPGVGWANALWGFQSQVYLVLIFGILALTWLAKGTSRRELVAGCLAMGAATLAMGPGLAVPLTVVVTCLVCRFSNRGAPRRSGLVALTAAALFLTLYLSRGPARELASVRPKSLAEFFVSSRSMLAFPFLEIGFASLLVQLPLAILLSLRLGRWHAYPRGGDVTLSLGLFFWIISGAAAASRGGAVDFGMRVPWRYIDFCTLGIVANFGAAWVFAAALEDERKKLAGGCAAAWTLAILLGWSASTADVWRGVIGPRVRDREAPVRLIQEFQRTGNAAIFAGQPRLLIPHPNPEVVRHVLADPRMQGHLPPSLQPERPIGPLSRAVRWVLRRPN